MIAMRIKSLLKQRGKDEPHGSGLGKTRYVVERTFSRLATIGGSNSATREPASIFRLSTNSPLVQFVLTGYAKSN